MGLVDVRDLYPDYDPADILAAGNSGPGWPARVDPPPVRCTHDGCDRVIEFADGRWVHLWPADLGHVATPPET